MSALEPSAAAAPAGPDEGDLALPRPPSAIRRWLGRHPVVVDAAVVFFAQVAPGLLVLIAATAPLSDVPFNGWHVAGTAASVTAGGVVLMLRRRRPLLAAIVCGLLAVLPSPYNLGGGIAVFVALYSLGVYSTMRRTWLGYGIASAFTVAAAATIGLAAALNDSEPIRGLFGEASVALPNIVVYLVPTLMGVTIGNRRRYVEAIIARASDLARERDQRARLAVADERARIAREMHDIVSHSLTVIVTLSEGAAAQAEAGRPGAPDAMRTVAETGRSSLAEMRRLLGVLRAPGEEAGRTPQPGAADLDELVERFREAGMPVRLVRRGPPVDDRALQLAVFRIMQEGLTNALRHAPGAADVTARVAHDADGVVVEVTNGPGTRPAVSPAGRGSGIVGIRERVAVHDGEVEAGPAPGGGWRLRAQLKEET
ncbi:sensor histidine kinase [Microbacterium marinilacus]|uniref:histidine kinase n=1 Tax=Microbacterium marinilacus TaxID=415209 RepID=A0ABP7BY97_9MICO|nr:histidine kinase [Microbacterium marinilacus]MBY0688077.1 two-component sensor histidine kinase [Microbacterium marinilacus]